MMGAGGEDKNVPEGQDAEGFFSASPRVRVTTPGVHFSPASLQGEAKKDIEGARQEVPPRPAGRRFSSPDPLQGQRKVGFSSGKHFAPQQSDRSLYATDDTAVFLAMAGQKSVRKAGPPAEAAESLQGAGRRAQGSDAEKTGVLQVSDCLRGQAGTKAVGYRAAVAPSVDAAPKMYSAPVVKAVSATSAKPPHTKAPRSGKRSRMIATVLIVVGVVLLAVAGFLFVRAQLGYKEARDAYGKIQNSALHDVQSELGDNVPNVDFDALAAVSKDIVGWIYIPNTQVNYPVVQGESNEQYLRHLPDGTYNMNGSIFMDVMDTAPGMFDQQTTLYGHHMNDDSMFRVIDKTLDQSVFDEIEHVYYITPDVTYVLTPMFTAQVQDTFVDARRPMFEDNAAFHAYLDDLLAQAKAKAPDAAERADKADNVLTLITCAGEIIPRTTRAAMVLSIDEMVARN